MRTGIPVKARFAVASISALIVSGSLFSARVFGQVAGSRTGQPAVAKPAWLEGAGKDLRIRVKGEVLDESGAPANDCKLVVTLKTRFGATDLPATIERNQFQVWAPVGAGGLYNVHLTATSADGRRVARESISRFQLRQAATDGLKLTIKPPERTVYVKVVDQGEPVPDAFVAAEILGGPPLTARTNGMGIARFPVRNRDSLSQLTAWTNDFRIGGYSFGRDPPRDPSGGKFTIELDPCRPQVIRLINDEDKAPVPDIAFVLTVGTGAPNYQFLGDTPGCEMKTNDQGEAVYRWFPDWKTHGSYVALRDPDWVKVEREETADDAEEIVEGAIVVRIKKRRPVNRKRIVGQVASTENNVAGFFVEIQSFQDRQFFFAFTDENGTFAADYLPGSTYCIYVNDARYVSNIIDLIPYEPAGEKAHAPWLTISKGEPVEVAVTSGPAKSPVAHQWIHLETPHHYTWREDGETQNGSSGRRWWVTTDEQGRAHTFALPGEKIQGSIYTPEWRATESAGVTANGVTRLEFHREIAEARQIVGRLLLAEDVAADLEEAVIEVGSVDGQTHERLTCSADRRGEFELQSMASQLGIYARTRDAKAAAVAVFDRLDQPLKLRLKPTGELHGQLLGKEDLPLEGHAVHATLRVSGKRDFNSLFPKSFMAATFDAETDTDGSYTLSGLPCEVALGLRADPIDGPASESFLDDFYLVPNEPRPRTISRLWKPERNIPFAERYAGILRDCHLSNFHAMVILFRPADDARAFVDANFVDYQTTREIMSFMQIQGGVGDKAPGLEVAEFARSRNWPLPENGRILAVAIDPAGRELGRIEIDSKDPAGPKLASDFVRKHAPVQVDAKEKWDEAFAAARHSGRKVWVRISQRYCRPCFLLSRWLDDQKRALDEDYVFLKIDDVRDRHGTEVAQRLEWSDGQGVPFHAVFDSQGKLLITSEGPLGNIGHPSGFEGKKHLRKMLLETRDKLTEKQIDEIVATLSD
jgi:hypothetical protein